MCIDTLVVAVLHVELQYFLPSGFTVRCEILANFNLTSLYVMLCSTVFLSLCNSQWEFHCYLLRKYLQVDIVRTYIFCTCI